MFVLTKSILQTNTLKIRKTFKKVALNGLKYIKLIRNLDELNLTQNKNVKQQQQHQQQKRHLY